MHGHKGVSCFSHKEFKLCKNNWGMILCYTHIRNWRKHNLWCGGVIHYHNGWRRILVKTLTCCVVLLMINNYCLSWPIHASLRSLNFIITNFHAKQGSQNTTILLWVTTQNIYLHANTITDNIIIQELIVLYTLTLCRTLEKWFYKPLWEI